MAKEPQKTFTTPPCILAFGHLYRKHPTSKLGNKQPVEKWRYQGNFLFNPDAPGWDEIITEVERLKALGDFDHCALKYSGHGKSWDGFPGRNYINAKATDRKPKLRRLDEDGKLIPVEEEEGLLYDGCIVRASLKFFRYDKETTGIGCELVNVQWLKDGPQLSGSDSDPEDDFGTEEVDTSMFEDAVDSVLG